MAEPLQGALTLDTVPGLLAHSAELCARGRLDLQQLAQVDSAGVAFLLHLQRQARSHGATLRYAGAPPQLLELARFLGVAGLLDGDGAGT